MRALVSFIIVVVLALVAFSIGPSAKPIFGVAVPYVALDRVDIIEFAAPSID